MSYSFSSSSASLPFGNPPNTPLPEYSKRAAEPAANVRLKPSPAWSYESDRLAAAKFRNNVRTLVQKVCEKEHTPGNGSTKRYNSVCKIGAVEGSASFSSSKGG